MLKIQEIKKSQIHVTFGDEVDEYGESSLAMCLDEIMKDIYAVFHKGDKIGYFERSTDTGYWYLHELPNMSRIMLNTDRDIAIAKLYDHLEKRRA